MMKNPKIKKELKFSKFEFYDISNILKSSFQNKFTTITKYMTHYCIIKSCGVIERCYKNMISDFFEYGQSKYVRNYITSNLRNKSKNPSVKNINDMLAAFDVNFKQKFLDELDKRKDKNIILSSIESLRQARNELAHGGNPTCSFLDVMNYFNESLKLLYILEDILEYEMQNEYLMNWLFN